MKKLIISCVALLLITVCMASSISCFSNGNSAQPREGENYTSENLGFSIVPVIPIAKDGKEKWKYTTNNPGDNWYSKSFNDAAWAASYAAFGTSTSHKTSWTTTDIWIRKEFTLEGYSPSIVDSLMFKVSHDEDCQIYINGVLAAQLGGWSDYKNVEISAEAKASIVVGEKNVIAAHCYNGGGAGGIDIGIYRHITGSMVSFFKTADIEAATWKYVTEAPESLEWMKPTYDDVSWSEGQACFGNNRSNYKINTPWTTTDIWLRKNVSLKGFSKSRLKNLELYLLCDGECQVYFNGVLVVSLNNGMKKESYPIPAEAINAISADGEATIAVHSYRKLSQKLFDASLSCYMDSLFSPIKWEMKEGPLMSVFAKDVDVNNVWSEYPRPQMVREEWQSLNGLWEFQPLFAEKVGMPEDVYSMEILVPFPVESPISGIMEKYNRFAYKRTFSVPEKWEGRNLLLHFEAVDFECEVFVNGKSVGSHKGGYDPFEFDVTEFLVEGKEQELVVKVYDPTDLGGQPRGKQTLSPGGIMYTSTSGIWQSVWMEPVEKSYIDKYTVVPDVDNSSITVNVAAIGSQEGKAVISVKDGDKVVATAETAMNKNVAIPVTDAKLWSPDSPFLYDIDIALVENGKTVDMVKGYFGMRKISLGKDGGYTRMFLNNKPLFHIGPLDQGFWPDGIYTAPTDAAMLYDIQATKNMGFNMIRKHIKVEPRRWYYHCDRLGMLVWQDMPSGNSYGGVGIDKTQFKKELTAMVESHYNSPSVIMWIIFNESQGRHDVEALVKYVKSLDASRLVNQDSQYGTHSTYIGDVWDVHHYPNPAYVPCSNKNLANVCGEYGGLKYKEDGHIWGAGDWGYATMNSRKELMDTYEKYVYDLVKFRDCFGMGGAVYTQTTDVEIEINGLITYDRAIEKVDFERMAKINSHLTKSSLKKDTIIATAMEGGEMWKMTTLQPSSNWYTPDFDDSSWKERMSGFGTAGTPNAVVRTTWSSSDIWIRKNFRLDGMNRQMADSLVMMMTHDEDCEIYINGKLMASYTGHDNNYSFVDFTTEVKNALVYDADNVIAVHCKQTYGGQFIDLGIYLLSEKGLTTSIAGVNAENKPYIAIDKVNKTVSIAGGGFGEDTDLDVINAAGNIVKSVVAGTEEVCLSALSAGVYVLRFTDGDKRYICKVIF